MKPFAIAPLALLAAALAGASAHAATYHYTDHWDYIAKPALGAAEFDDRLQADAATCDSIVGAQHGAPTAGYRSGMDCENIGGASVCSPPNGMVRYYDPDQGLNCTRSGLVSVCSNM